MKDHEDYCQDEWDRHHALGHYECDECYDGGCPECCETLPATEEHYDPEAFDALVRSLK